MIALLAAAARAGQWLLRCGTSWRRAPAGRHRSGAGRLHAASPGGPVLERGPKRLVPAAGSDFRREPIPASRSVGALPPGYARSQWEAIIPLFARPRLM